MNPFLWTQPGLDLGLQERHADGKHCTNRNQPEK